MLSLPIFTLITTFFFLHVEFSFSNYYYGTYRLPSQLDLDLVITRDVEAVDFSTASTTSASASASNLQYKY